MLRSMYVNTEIGGFLPTEALIQVGRKQEIRYINVVNDTLPKEKYMKSAYEYLYLGYILQKKGRQSHPELLEMVTAHEEIDKIHQAEEEAKQLIEEANVSVREMKKETEAKIGEIMDQHEKDARQEAERLLKEKEDKKVKIEGTVLKIADAKIAEYNAVLKKKQDAAIDAVLKIILGEG